MGGLVPLMPPAHGRGEDNQSPPTHTMKFGFPGGACATGLLRPATVFHFTFVVFLVFDMHLATDKLYGTQTWLLHGFGQRIRYRPVLGDLAV